MFKISYGNDYKKVAGDFMSIFLFWVFYIRFVDSQFFTIKHQENTWGKKKVFFTTVIFIFHFSSF